jgi:alkaline phosphatase D
MPIRPSLWRSMSTPRLYRSVDWGDLASLSMLDTRQFRSSPACAAPAMARNVRLDHCAERLRPDRTMLGQAQENWLARRLAGERRPWTVLAQGVFFAPLALDGSGDAVYSDQWDGYAAARARLLDQLSGPGVRNALIMSGDIHSFWQNDLHHEPGKPPVATEIVTSALAAQSPPAGRFGDVHANNTHIRFSDMRHQGYVRIELCTQRLSAQFRAIDMQKTNAEASVIHRVEQDAKA